MVQFDEGKLNERYSKLRAKEAESLAQTLSGTYNIPYVDLSQVSINTDALRLVTEERARAANLAAYSFSGTDLNIVVLSPNKPEVDEIVKELETKERKVNLFIGTPESLRRAWDRYSEISTAFASKSGQIDIAAEQLNYFAQQNTKRQRM